MYYVNHNACPTLEDAEEIANIYRAAGVAVDILTEWEYFELGPNSTAEDRQRLCDIVHSITRRTLH